MIAPLDHLPPTPASQLKDTPIQLEPASADRALESTRQLIAKHPLVAVVCGVAIGVTAAWLMKRKSSNA